MDEILRPIFWDSNVSKIDLEKNARQVIERVLEYGDAPQVRFAQKIYPQKKIINVLVNSRQISPKSANFWAEYYNLSKEKRECLKKRLQKKPETSWPY
jgi:hypothetical protein